MVVVAHCIVFGDRQRRHDAESVASFGQRDGAFAAHAALQGIVAFLVEAQTVRLKLRPV